MYRNISKDRVWQSLFPNSPGNYYRPINLLWFRINDALFGLRPEGWHATTLLLHVLATYLVYVLARRLTERPLVAAATALVFGAHPMRHGVVAWVSGSTESLWAVCFLGAFLAYLQSREGRRIRWMAASCVLYAIALLSKETAIMLPAMVFMHSVIFGDQPADCAKDAATKWRAYLAAYFERCANSACLCSGSRSLRGCAHHGSSRVLARARKYVPQHIRAHRPVCGVVLCQAVAAPYPHGGVLQPAAAIPN